MVILDDFHEAVGGFGHAVNVVGAQQLCVFIPILRFDGAVDDYVMRIWKPRAGVGRRAEDGAGTVHQPGAISALHESVLAVRRPMDELVQVAAGGQQQDTAEDTGEEATGKGHCTFSFELAAAEARR